MTSDYRSRPISLLPITLGVKSRRLHEYLNLCLQWGRGQETFVGVLKQATRQNHALYGGSARSISSTLHQGEASSRTVRHPSSKSWKPKAPSWDFTVWQNTLCINFEQKPGCHGRENSIFFLFLFFIFYFFFSARYPKGLPQPEGACHCDAGRQLSMIHCPDSVDVGIIDSSDI